MNILKKKFCNRNAEVTSISSLSHLMIRWFFLCNKLKLTCFTKITLIMNADQSNIFLDYVKIIYLLKCKIIVGGAYE